MAAAVPDVACVASGYGARPVPQQACGDESKGMPDGFHEDFRSRRHETGPSERSFGLTIAAVLALVGVVKWWRAAPVITGQAGLWWLAAAIVFLVLGLWRSAPLRPLNRAWFRLGLVLHAVASPVVMALLFFCSVTPTALLLRMLGKDVLRLQRDDAAASYWIPRKPPGPVRGTMKDQF